jgi:predicted HAD superfamily Cof-like phosphohydrolase
MANVFSDQSKFMSASEQTVGKLNNDQLRLYLNLVTEEYQELQDAVTAGDRVETLDALLDLIVVAAGAVHSIGCDAEGAWKEVMGSNLSKIDRVTGKVKLREDGKVLKPLDWRGPDLKKYLNNEQV